VPATLNLSNQQVAIVTRRGQPTTVTLTATADDGTPFDLTGATVVAKVTTDKGGTVAEFAPTVDGNELALFISAADLDSALDPIDRANGEFVGRWYVAVQHDDLGQEPIPWVDGSFTVLAHGSRQAPTSNEVTVTVGATITTTLAATGPRGPVGAPGVYEGAVVDGHVIVYVPPSPWGIDANGDPYYDPAGAAPGEQAVMQFDPDTGNPILIIPTTPEA